MHIKKAGDDYSRIFPEKDFLRIKLTVIKKNSIGFILLMTLSACIEGTVDWYESFRFKAKVEDISVEKNELILKEYGGDSEDIYEIPVDNAHQYEVGENLKVIVYTNTLKDDWDLDHLKFKIISQDH